MAEHLSSLELDIAVTGALDGARRTHLDGCADCRQRLERERTATEAVKALPGHDATLSRLAQKTQPQAKVLPFRGRAPLLVAAALAVAAAVVLLVAPPKDEENRIKGAASVELIGAGDTPVTSAKVGDAVQLAVGAAGESYALVLSVDEHGTIEPLWPAGAAQSGPAPKGARAVLQSMEVTAGNVTLVAVFSPQPVELALARGAVMAALREGKSLEQLEVPGAVTATTRLQVHR